MNKTFGSGRDGRGGGQVGGGQVGGGQAVVTTSLYRPVAGQPGTVGRGIRLALDRLAATMATR